MLFALDLTLARVVQTTTEPMIGRIRLAWWREALAALDTAPPQAEPVLRAATVHLVPLVAGARLAGLEDGHLARIEGDEAAAAARGPALFALAAEVLRAPPDPRLGYAWGAGERVRSGDAAEMVAPPRRVTSRLRPLLALDRLGVRDARAPVPAPRGTLVRQWVIAATMLAG